MTPKVQTREIVSSNNTMRDFIRELYSCSKHNVIADKYDVLFNVSKMRGKKREDVECSSGFIMDFDNGELTPEECSRIFAQYSHCVRNCFSRSKDKPNKFHLFIPSKRNISPDHHPIIYDYLLSMLEDAGYDAKRAGLDLSKRYPESFFFIPCTNNNQPDMAFFLKHRCQTRQLERHCLDPLRVLANLPVEPTQLNRLYYEYEPADDEPNLVKDPEYAKRKIEDLKGQWLGFPTGQGQRYHGLFKIACGIGYYASDINEAQDILYELARDKKERDRIPGYIKSLQRYRL